MPNSTTHSQRGMSTILPSALRPPSLGLQAKVPRQRPSIIASFLGILSPTVPGMHRSPTPRLLSHIIKVHIRMAAARARTRRATRARILTRLCEHPFQPRPMLRHMSPKRIGGTTHAADCACDEWEELARLLHVVDRLQPGV